MHDSIWKDIVSTNCGSLDSCLIHINFCRFVSKYFHYLNGNGGYSIILYCVSKAIRYSWNVFSNYIRYGKSIYCPNNSIPTIYGVVFSILHFINIRHNKACLSHTEKALLYM